MFRRKDDKRKSFHPDHKPLPKEKKTPSVIRKTPLKKKLYKIKARSNKRIKEEKIYETVKKIFLVGKICPITGGPATQVHHKKGRIGKLLYDVRFFLGVSDEGHKYIEANPEFAYKNGYSLLRTKTTPDAATDNDQDSKS